MKPSVSLPFATYNPDLIDREGFVAQFVARVPLLERILEDLRDERPQHHLLHGQRGMGKSTLLRRVHIAVDDDPELRRRWLALSFPEEQWNIARLSDFWINCADAALDALAGRGQEALAHTFDAAVEALPEGDEGARAKAALALLREVMKRVDGGLVLLVDNLDVVLGRLTDKERWTLRKTFTHDRMTLVGASVTVPEAVTGHKEAFYDAFKLDELRGLSVEETTDVLRKLAGVRKTPRVLRVLDEDPGRVRALHVLTGGNPRTVTLLHELLAREDVRTVEQDLASLLDHVTPLYKARFEELPTQAQQVVNDLALHWAPTTAAEAAKRLQMDVKNVSAQLDRLVKLGVVEKVPQAHGRLRFQVGERFFNIWYLMRASRRTRRKLLWLVEFLRVFYGDAGLRGHARSYLAMALPPVAGDRERHVALLRAMADAVEDSGLKSALEVRAVEALIDHGAMRRRIAELVDLGGDDAALAPKLDRMTALRQVREGVLAAKVKLKEGWDPEAFWLLLGGAASLDLRGKRRVVEQLPAMSAKALRALIAELTEEAKRWQENAATQRLPDALREGLMEGLDDVEGASVAVQRYGEPGLVDEVMRRRLAEKCDAAALLAMGEYLPHAYQVDVWAAWLTQAMEREVPLDRFPAWVDCAERDAFFWRRIVVPLHKKFVTPSGEVQLDHLLVLHAMIRASLALIPDDTTGQKLFARGSTILGDSVSALKAFEWLAAHHAMDQEDWLHMGRVALEADELSKALTAFEQVLKVSPAHQEALRGGAYVTAVLHEFQPEKLLSYLRAHEGAELDPGVELVCGILAVSRGEASGLSRMLRSWPSVTEEHELMSLTSLVLTFCLHPDAALLDHHLPENPLRTAAIHALQGKPAQGLTLLRDAFDDFNAHDHVPPFDAFRVCFWVFIQRGHARALLEQLEASLYGEEWLPVLAALRLVAAPTEHSLEDLPVELRSVVDDLVRQLMMPPLLPSAAPPEGPTRKRKRA